MTTNKTPTPTRQEAGSRGAMPDSMDAMVQSRYGSADRLKATRVPMPEIGSGDVLIDAEAAGLDRGVWHLTSGEPYLIRLMGFGLTRPKTQIPGSDVAGRVVAVGTDVERFSVGDAVFGIARGSFASYTAAPESKLAHKPANATYEQAAVSAISGITALQALTDVAAIEAGQEVLVIGASGGVGSFAVQIARALGARVTGVASGAKAGLIRSLGAEEVIDYATDDYLDGRTRYDVIVDTGGRNPIRHLRRALNRKGTLVIVGGEGGGRWTGGIGRQLRALMVSPFVSQRLTMLISKEHHSDIDRLGALIESGEVVPAVGERFDLARTADAFRKLAAGEIGGKAVIIVGDGAHKA